MRFETRGRESGTHFMTGSPKLTIIAMETSHVQCAVNVACVDEAELAYGSLLIVLDDGSRYGTPLCHAVGTTVAYGESLVNLMILPCRAKQSFVFLYSIFSESRLVPQNCGTGELEKSTSWRC